MGMIHKESRFSEGEVFIRWAENRIKKNKNLICVQTGPTGSGKSMCDLRKAELIHRKFFKEEFPLKNVCFSIAELMERIAKGDLRKGEVIILEEAGVNAGSGDWQNRVVKMFNYLLQSFRSMNIILLMNLPVLSMLAKQGRQLVHMHMTTVGIDFETESLKVKALAHQLNQSTGKSYWKYLRVKAGKKVVSVERMIFFLPSQELIDKYESKKQSFLLGITQEFAQEIRKREQEKLDKVARHLLSPIQLEIKKLTEEGLNTIEIGKIVGIAQPNVGNHIKRMKKWGYTIEIPSKMPKNQLSTIE